MYTPKELIVSDCFLKIFSKSINNILLSPIGLRIGSYQYACRDTIQEVSKQKGREADGTSDPGSHPSFSNRSEEATEALSASVVSRAVADHLQCAGRSTPRRGDRQALWSVHDDGASRDLSPTIAEEWRRWKRQAKEVVAAAI